VGEIFCTNDEVKHFVEQWLDKHPETFFAKGIIKQPGNGNSE
jgi:hypothetical protein